MRRVFLFIVVVVVNGCGQPPPDRDSGGPSASVPVVAKKPVAKSARLEYAIALHAGAGKPPEGLTAMELVAYKRTVIQSLTEALTVGRDMLSGGKTSLDVVERVVRHMEDDPKFNAGRGAVLNIDGGFELHASIMDGKTRDCGAVAAIDTVKNPISLARLVMDTDFILLVGEGAERFATEKGIKPVDADYLRTELQHNNWRKARAEFEKSGRRFEKGTGTVGCVALDKHGNLAAATSTGGVAHKRFGRMGDSSIIGAGNYADNRTCAVSCTGRGEHFIRNSMAFHVAAVMQYQEKPLADAVKFVIDDVLKDGTGGLIAVDGQGNIAMHFNRDGMRRAAADSSGRFDVEYWE